MPNQQYNQDSLASIMSMLNPVGQATLMGVLGYDFLAEDYRRQQEAERAARAQAEADRLARMSAQDKWYYNYLQQNQPSTDQYYDMIATQGVRPGQPIGWYY